MEKWKNRNTMCQRPISPSKESSYSDSHPTSILRKQKIHGNHSIELRNYALMTLRNQINPFQYNKNITLTMPRTFPTCNYDIMLFNQVQGDRVCYSKVMLPLWSVLGNSPGQCNETRTYQCSQREVFDTLTDEISCHAKWMKMWVRFKKRDEGRQKMTTVTSDHSSLQNHLSQIKMLQLAPVYSPDQEILNWLRTVLNQEDISDPATVLPPNNIPRPSPLTNFHDYFPLLDSVCWTQLGYLCNSLYHPDVTNADSFHAILLTTNHALQLKMDLFDEHCLQRMHTFNATLAELQGPNRLPISLWVGHAVIHFFTGEHDCEYTRFGDKDEAYPLSAWLRDEIPVHGGRNACDSVLDPTS